MIIKHEEFYIHKYVFINIEFFKLGDPVIWVQNPQKKAYLFMGHPVFMIKRDLLGKRKLSPQESKIVTFNLGHIFRQTWVPYSSKTTFSSAP